MLINSLLLRTELKIICEETIYKKLSSTNAVEYLKLADLHNAPNLKKQVVDFIVSNVNDMLATPDFKLIGNCEPEIIYEVIRAFASELRKHVDSSRKCNQ